MPPAARAGAPIDVAPRPSLRFAGSDSSCRGRRSDLDLVDQHHIDDMQAVVRADHDRGSSPGLMRDEIGMGHVDPGPVRQAERKRPKWCRVDHLLKILRPHVLDSSQLGGEYPTAIIRMRRSEMGC